jgi:hypothetical protein
MNRKFMQFKCENHANDGQHKRLLSEIRPAELGLYGIGGTYEVCVTLATTN